MDDQDRARWVKLVADVEGNDLTQRECSPERGVSFGKLPNWIHRLRKETRPLVTEAAEVACQGPKAAPVRKGSRLVPVEVVASAAKPRTRRQGSPSLIASSPAKVIGTWAPSA